MNSIDNGLGLPLEYQDMPEYFDAHNVSEETEAKNGVIESLLSEHDVQTVIDLTCGTGSQVFFLKERGYDVVGADFSPALLDIAREKAFEKGVDVSFIDGDMRSISVGQFDAAITIFNAIGHMAKSDFKEALRNVHSNLKDGGVYVFDIFNLQAITDEVISDFAMDIDKVVNGVRVHNIQYSEVDKDKGLLTSHDSYRIFKESEPEVVKNSFSLQIYTVIELQEMLDECGFDVVGVYDMEGNVFVENKSLSILVVGKKR